MSIDLAQTSLPAWSHTPAVEPADPSGLRHTVLAIGEETSYVVTRWRSELSGREVEVHTTADAGAAAAVLVETLETARVGHRFLVTGTAADCLAVRAAAVRAGVADDELVFGVLDASDRSVWCVHCDATTRAGAELDAVVGCSGCGRSLVVYPHVSRRTGHHLGFMVDAEDQPWSVPS